MDGNAYNAQPYLCNRYEPHSMFGLIQLSREFQTCCLKSTKMDPDEWFIQIDTLRNRMSQIDPVFEKKDVEIIAHIIDKLPAEYSMLITVLEGMPAITLLDLKRRIRLFYNRKFKSKKNGDEHELYASRSSKNKCNICGKKDHCATSLCSVSNNAGKKNKGRGIKCFNCNKYTGHIAKDCPEPTQTRKKQGYKNDKDKYETEMFVGMAVTF